MDEKKIVELTEELDVDELGAVVGGKASGKAEIKYNVGDVMKDHWCESCNAKTDFRCTTATYLAGSAGLRPIFVTLWECTVCGKRIATNTH